MSYDIDFGCPTCHSGPERLNPTYNLTPLFDLALTGEPLPNPDTSEMAVVLFREKTDRPRGLRILSGRTGAESLVPLRKALGHLEDPAKRAAFDKLAEPNKGWGTHEDAVWVVRKMIEMAESSPTSVWNIQ
jgi:hypothetical protein